MVVDIYRFQNIGRNLLGTAGHLTGNTLQALWCYIEYTYITTNAEYNPDSFYNCDSYYIEYTYITVFADNCDPLSFTLWAIDLGYELVTSQYAAMCWALRSDLNASAESGRAVTLPPLVLVL